MVADYPEKEVRGIFDDAIDRYESAQIKDVLKIVKEINNRLDALINSNADRLGPALDADESAVLRKAVDAMSAWFENYKEFLK